MKPMRILFLSQVLPYPLDAGPKMRSYYVLRHLAQEHEVTLLTFTRDSDQADHIAHLASICQDVHTVPMQRSRLQDVKYFAQSCLSRDPFLILRDHVPAMAETLQELLRSTPFDAIHADQLWMAQYALAAKTITPQIKIVLDQHNAVHLIPQRLANGSHFLKRHLLLGEAQRLADYEADVCQRFDQVVWVTAEDRAVVTALDTDRLNGHQPAPVIPICADPADTALIVPTDQPFRITFLGGLHWPPNAQGLLWFADQVFPQVKSLIPQAILTVIGKSPPAGLTGEGIEVTGYVVDPTPYLAETAVFIVPLHAGGGMRVKILDAWTWGLPIVSTTIGAEGIETQPEQDILIADRADAFAQAVMRIFQDPALAQRLRDCGRQTVIEKYSWQVVYQAWDQIY